MEMKKEYDVVAEVRKIREANSLKHWFNPLQFRLYLNTAAKNLDESRKLVQIQ
ncbi:hypothetical protein SAMN05518672_10225 [Chitinophaga sp. CF118]|uniref:hypothetical protein n=1 Tax=Chitinophaga sp. CF118 TaxID=1884367 RepID=UPI0008E9A55A|nr:hypothetical protein [Chitinophaga sp. CF118]SFD45725.1 hypothetical protein SAMN05518672_10225 [Chitinophaga sp. CF118]